MKTLGMFFLLFIFASCDHADSDTHSCFCDVGDLACDDSVLIVCNDHSQWVTLFDCRDNTPGQWYCCESDTDDDAACCEAGGER
jgi:hypothetical protein